jgi:hypothetical protein
MFENVFILYIILISLFNFKLFFKKKCIYLMTVEELRKIAESEGDSFTGKYLLLNYYGLRNSYFLNWCGYIEIPMNHKNFNIDSSKLYVHGGITFDQYKDDKRVLGFDCAHYTDTYLLNITENSNYKNKEYIISECERLIDQIHKVYLDDINMLEVMKKL